MIKPNKLDYSDEYVGDGCGYRKLRKNKYIKALEAYCNYLEKKLNETTSIK